MRLALFVSPRFQPYVIAVLACLALGASAGYDLHRERAQEIENGRNQTAALARLLEEHVRQQFRRAEAKLDEFAGGPATAPQALPGDGFLSALEPVEPSGVAGLERSEPGSLAVDRARRTAAGEWGVVVAKRIRPRAGAADVAWQAQLNLQALQRLLDAADTRNNGFATLFSTDGWLLATAPRNESLFSRNWGDTPMFKEHLPRASSGTVQQVVVRDGTERLYSYRKVEGYPLVISAGISMTDALAGWRQRLLWDVMLLTLISLAFFAGAFFMSRSVRRGEQAQQAMEAARNDALRSETFLRTVTDNLPLRIAYSDTTLRYRFVNQAHCRRFGLPREQILGRTRQELTGQDVPAPLSEALARVLQGQPQSIEYEEVDADGSRRALATLLVPDLAGNGLVQGFYSASLDVTERFEQRQRLDAALKERETLLREVYHRVKNNLQVVQSLLGLQRRTVDDAAAREALDESTQRVRAMSLVHEKLYQTGSLEAVSLREYTLDLMDDLREATGAGSRGIELKADIPVIDVRLEVAIPYGLLVNELVSNSLKHGFPAGGPGRVLLKVERTERGLRLTLRDEGVGLAEGFSLETDTSLGLQLACSLAAQLGGELMAHNDGGAVFTAELTALP